MADNAFNSENLDAVIAKAVLNVTGPGGDIGTADFGGASQAPTSTEQVMQFLELMSAEQALLPIVRTVTSDAAKWQESVISFWDRIAHGATEATRLDPSDREKPGTQVVEMSTVTIRSEVEVSDETFEDTAAGLRDSLERLIADRFGYDVEDLLLNGDINGGDPFYNLLNGWLYRIANGGNGPIDGTDYGKDYQAIFKSLIQLIPYRFLPAIKARGKFFVPQAMEFEYRDQLAARGTALGDASLTTQNNLRYQGIEIVPVPLMPITDSDPDTSKIILCDPKALYAGFHRKMTFETFRDPREGATSFITTARVDANVALPEMFSYATDVDVSR